MRQGLCKLGSLILVSFLFLHTQIARANPGAIYAATNNGVFKSTDGGANWTHADSGLLSMAVFSLAIDPSNAATLYAGTLGGGVFKSTDGGQNWTTAGGQSWTPTNNGLIDNIILSVAVDPSNPHTVYCGTAWSAFFGDKGVFKSTDGAQTWAVSNSGLPADLDGYYPIVDVLRIDPTNSDIVYAGTNYAGVFKSSNGGLNWTAASSGMVGLVNDLAIDPSNSTTLYAATYDFGFFKSTNGGVSWTAINQGIPEQRVISLAVDPTNSEILYAGTYSQGVFKSNNGGSTWFSINSGLQNTGYGIDHLPLVLDPLNPGTIYAGTFNGVFKSTNGGTSWTSANNGLSPATHIYALAVTALNETSTLFVPVLVSTPGLTGSLFTSEMILTNKGSRDAILDLSYTSAFGGGTGKGSDHLAAGHQLIVPDAISYLRSLGIPIPGSGNLGGTLTVAFSELESTSDAAITVRTTTAVEGGRAGSSYPGVPLSSALNETVYLCGLRQNALDRSNVAVQNAGLSDQSNVVLRLTVFSGDPNTGFSQVLPDITLPPGGFSQISQILQSNGMNLPTGYVKVERISGSAPYYAYAVINDQVNSDGSFVFPIRESDFLGLTLLTIPVLVEANTFSSELIVTNWSQTTKTLHCEFISDAIQTQDKTVDFTIEVKTSEQLSIPDFIDYLRKLSIPEIGPKGPAFAGALFVTVTEGDLSGIAVSARTSSPGGGGRYGLFYRALPDQMASDHSAWIYGLQQNTENRSNLAVVNIGETDSSADTLNVEIFDGDTGTKAATIEGISLSARGWKQFGAILADYTSGVTQGYARVTKTGGNNRFIIYGVVNDGGQPGQRTGDGTFIASTP